jgi:F-type H+-transporting ATPase subunit a
MIALNPSRSSFAASAVRLLAPVVFLLALVFALAGQPLFAAETAHGGRETGNGVHAEPTAVGIEAGAGHEEHHGGLPPEAPRLLGFITNSMLVTWVVAAGIILFAQMATRRIRSTKEAALEVPGGAQNFWEFLVESLRNFLEEIIGRDLAKKTFWFFATVFIFILFTNWFGLLPGVGTIGWGHPDAHGVMNHIQVPLLRGGNADLNMTFAMSAIFFVMWTVWAFQTNGAGGFVKHLFGAKGDSKGAMAIFMAVIFVLVGLLEVISIMFRPVSLSFRLYGNIFAGENLLEAMQGVSPAFGWLTPIPFYFMELLVGLVQALVFMLLTAVFTLLICSHDEEEGHGAHH